MVSCVVRWFGFWGVQDHEAPLGVRNDLANFAGRRAVGGFRYGALKLQNRRIYSPGGLLDFFDGVHRRRASAIWV
jgi:hypothetical protein